jgi:hypothetical protein
LNLGRKKGCEATELLRGLPAYVSIYIYGLGCAQRIAAVANIIVGGKNVRLLLDQQLADRQRQFPVERVGIGLFGLVLALFGGLKQRVIAAAELRLYLRPGPMQGAGDRARLVYVSDAMAVQLVFEFSAEVCSFQRFSKEITF